MDNVERLNRRLHQLGGDVQRFLTDLERRNPRRRRRHHRGARGVRADAMLDAVGLAVNDAHLLHVGAEHFGSDLSHHGLEALPDRRAAGDDLDLARGVDLNAHAVGRTEPRLLDEHREADADHLALRRGARRASRLSFVHST